MFDSHFIVDVLPLLTTLGVSFTAWLLPISRRDYVVAFVAALTGVVVPVALTVSLGRPLAEEFGMTVHDMVLFWVPVFTAPGAVAAVEALRGRRVSWRGVVAGLAFVSIYATNLSAHYRRTGGPEEFVSGVICLVGWVLAPAAIVAIAYSLGVWKDDKVREARARDGGDR